MSTKHVCGVPAQSCLLTWVHLITLWVSHMGNLCLFLFAPSPLLQLSWFSLTAHHLRTILLLPATHDVASYIMVTQRRVLSLSVYSSFLTCTDWPTDRPTLQIQSRVECFLMCLLLDVQMIGWLVDSYFWHFYPCWNFHIHLIMCVLIQSKLAAYQQYLQIWEWVNEGSCAILPFSVPSNTE